MKFMLGWHLAILLAAAAFAIGDREAFAQAPVDSDIARAAGDAAAADGEDPARRRSILRRDRRAESAPPAAPATDAPAFRPQATAPAAAAAPATNSAPKLVAPATADEPSGLQFDAERPAAYSAPLGHPYLGITFDLRYPNAAVVKSVAPGGPAAQSGIRPGDAIHAINRSFIATWQDVVATVQSLRPGDQLDISYSRRVEERTQVILTGRNAEGAQTATYSEPPAAPPEASLPTPAPAATLPPQAATDEVQATPPATRAQTPTTGDDDRGGRIGRDRSTRPARQRGGLFRRN